MNSPRGAGRIRHDEGMNEREYLRAVEEFALYLAALQESLDPDSYDLLLRILKGTNEALVQRRRDTEIPLSERDQDLFTPEFGQRLHHLLELLGPFGMRTFLDADSFAAGRAAPAEREQIRREVEAIADASGMNP